MWTAAKKLSEKIAEIETDYDNKREKAITDKLDKIIELLERKNKYVNDRTKSLLLYL